MQVCVPPNTDTGPSVALVWVKRPRAAERIHEAGGRGGVRRSLEIFAPHRERQATTGGQDDARGPELDIQLVSFARCEWLERVVGVIRSIRRAEMLIQAAMARGGPAPEGAQAQLLEHSHLGSPAAA